MEQATVVGAVIRNEAGEILCALRSEAMSNPGVWEFPGGKVEPGEDPEIALIREIQEELGCRIQVLEKIEETEYAYSHTEIRLLTFWARLESGEPKPREHRSVRWLPQEELYQLDWAPADVPTVRLLLGDYAEIE